MKRLPAALFTLGFLLSFPAGGPLAADVKKGARAFNKCKACHTLVEGRHRVGPSLHGLFGRVSGAAPGYSYSAAMKKAGADGLVWTDETLAAYLREPRTYVKGTKMAFAGIRKESELRDLIAFLKEATQ